MPGKETEDLLKKVKEQIEAMRREFASKLALREKGYMALKSIIDSIKGGLMEKINEDGPEIQAEKITKVFGRAEQIVQAITQYATPEQAKKIMDVLTIEHLVALRIAAGENADRVSEVLSAAQKKYFANLVKIKK